jgi:hypothetical protein
MEERVLEHEILKALFAGTGFAITVVGSEAKGYIPIYKRSYGNCLLHFGTLVDILNKPQKYKTKPADDNNIHYLQNKITRREEVEIREFEWFAVSDAIEMMKNNGHLSDDSPTGVLDDVVHRIIGLKYEGAIAYMNKYYLKEYKKAQLSGLEEERLKLDVDKLRNEYFDYPTTKARAKWGFYIAIVTIIISFLALLVSIFNDK